MPLGTNSKETPATAHCVTNTTTARVFENAMWLNSHSVRRMWDVGR